MMPTTDTMLRIVQSGGGLDLDVSTIPADTLRKLASAAAPHVRAGTGNTLVFRNGGRLKADDMAAIAKLGQGSVRFVF